MTDEYEGPPDLQEAKIDFSIAHFLDHSIWQCGKGDYQYGGRRVHLRYAWDFKWRPSLRSKTKCKVGWHSAQQVWRRRDGVNVTWECCFDCGKRLSGEQPE